MSLWRTCNCRKSPWTVKSELTDSAERFVKEAPAELTVRQLIDGYQQAGSPLPAGLMICNLNSGTLPYRVLQSKFEIATLNVSLMERRLDVRWTKKGERGRWVSSASIADGFDRRTLVTLRESSRDRGEFAIQVGDVATKNLEEFCGVMAYREISVLTTQPIGKFLSELTQNNRNRECYIYANAVRQFTNLDGRLNDEDVSYIERDVLRQCDRIDLKLNDIPKFVDCVRSSRLMVFDPHERSGRKYQSSIFI